VGVALAPAAVAILAAAARLAVGNDFKKHHHV
jgi:hypothetical protein